VSSKVEIGRFTSINGPSTRIAAAINKVRIGSFCSIASGTVIQEYYHKYDRITTYYINKNIFGGRVEDDIFSKGDIIIEDDVWIGSNVAILSGVTVGRGSIIGAGSVITKDIPKYSIVGGNPAKILKSRFKEETTEYLESLQWWNWSTDELIKNKHLFNMKENDLSDSKI
jgi:virginiamycin A acetyltransferase